MKKKEFKNFSDPLKKFSYGNFSIQLLMTTLEISYYVTYHRIFLRYISMKNFERYYIQTEKLLTTL